MRLITIGFLFFSTSSFAQPTEVDSLILDYVNSLPANAEVSIAYFENGQTYRYGFHVSEDEAQAVDNFDKLYEIGSITKTFTTSLLMEQVALGEMKLDDPIQKYLPVEIKEAYFEGHTITLLNLATHTSGLSNGPSQVTMPFLRAKIFTPQNPNRNFKARHYYNYLKKFELDYIPGQKWDYNNFGIALLGELIAIHNQTTWEDLVSERIFKPIGMTNSYFRIDQSNETLAVQGYNEKGKKTARWEMDFIAAAGGINSCLNDMLKYVQAQLNTPSPELNFLQAGHDNLNQNIIFRDSTWSMGIGWWHRIKDDPYQSLNHDGATGGFCSSIWFDKKRNKGVVILSNFAYDHPQMRTENDKTKPFELARALMNVEN